MTNVKRPILLQVRSLQDSSSSHRNNDVDEFDGAPFREDDPPTTSVCGPSIVRRRPIKTQSMVLPSLSCESPNSLRAPVTAKLEDQLKYYSSPIQDVSPPIKSSSTNKFSTFSSPSSSASSSSGSTDSDSPSLILPYLYVGDQTQTQMDTISSLNISYILSLQSLPKFLSNSPQSTPPATPTMEVSSQVDENLIMLRNDFTDEVNKLSQVNINKDSRPEKRLSSRTSCGTFDIIDGGDGGLLPSVNSSKDYLVKIKPLNKLKTDKNEQIVKKQLTSEYDKEDQQNLGAEHDSDLAETICDTTILDFGIEAPMKSNISDGHDSNKSQSVAQKCIRHHEASYSDALLSCSLKQRCNRISSSVHRLIRGKCINISDTFEQLLDKFFDETHNFIEEARRNKCNVLVHCKAGISRSPTIAIAYLMKWKRLHLHDAYNFVKQCRPQISPNLNFMGQLVSYERQLQRDRSQLSSPTSCCLPSPRPADNLAATSNRVTETSTGRTSFEEHKKDCDSVGGPSDVLSKLKNGKVGKKVRVRNFFRCKNHHYQQKKTCILPHHDAQKIPQFTKEFNH